MRRVTQRFRAETDGTLRLVRGWLNEGVRMWKKEVQIGWFASTAAWRGREGVWEDYLILKKMERYTRGGLLLWFTCCCATCVSR